MAMVCSTKGSHDSVPSRITSRPSFSAVTSSDDAASVDDWCTWCERSSSGPDKHLSKSVAAWNCVNLSAGVVTRLRR
jgi:hypothetical protein